MSRTRLQILAALACAANALLLMVVQLASRTPPPPVLFLLFTGLWIFGAAMLWWAPAFGAAGTAAWGVLSGVQVVRMHGLGAIDVTVASGALLAAGLAVAVLVERRRARA